MSSRTLIVAAVALGVLTGLYLWLRPAPVPPAPTEAPPMRLFEFVIRDGKVVSAPSTLAVTQGDRVTLQVESDRVDELHLHGYDLRMSLRPLESGVLTFQAERAGRFELELHHDHLELGALEVRPR